MRRSLMGLVILVILTFPIHIKENSSDYQGLASSWTVLPSRSLAGLHYIFKGYSPNEDHTLMKVTGPIIEITNGEDGGSKIYKEGYATEIDEEDFEQEQHLGQSVFEATSGNGSRVGTAFLVGKDIVLTNRHVISSTAHSTSWECGKFSILLNHRSERVGCKKVRYCSLKYDFCVIELSKMSDGMSVGSEVKILRLTQRVRTDKDASLLHIGNAGGLGVQASRGRGITLKDGEIYHYAPTLGGSSGAPLFNERREVIGVNWGHTGESYIGDSSFNRAVLIGTIYRELKRTHPYTLKDIKSFRSWYHREQTHRQVEIKPTIAVE